MSKYLLLTVIGVIFLAGTQVHGQSVADRLRLMTYNIRLNTESDGDNAWPKRKEWVESQIEFHRPDVLGVQEALPDQVEWLRENLEDYAFIGEGRQGNGKGEFSALYYDRRRFEAVRSGTFWLSSTSAEVSKGWDAALPRICTWAEFMPRDGGTAFLVLNTHFDHVGEEARRRSADLILERFDSLNPAGLPAAVMGDLNLTPETVPIQKFSDRLTDAYTAAPVRLGPGATFKGFEGQASGNRRIDYIFLSPDVEVQRYAVLSDWVDGRHPSDHYPVIVDIMTNPKPLIIAHRGASGHAPENTLAAFQKAIELDADMVELDVFTLADGEVVCFHDDELERLTGQEGKIADLTLAQVSELRVKDVHSIPRLKDVLHLLDKRLQVNVELKGEGTAGPTLEILREFIRDHDWRLADFNISSFRHDELRRMRQLDADIAIGILPHGDPLATLELAQELEAVSINAHHDGLRPEVVAAIDRAGLRIYAWTVNASSDIHRLLELGIDGIITNYPDRVTAALREER